ncbi:PucR family transcriptional regulator [Patulibacter defluvii]|uniref:PucR family transcriptional regulator n=1 Tax=Patulibacter defluvii TaxID=3095358 RepID=UPI002A75E178|nr:PucR family transcriptional regulator ligand-binding domain-containing protein [Patulibacter sp. DM4]
MAITVTSEETRAGNGALTVEDLLEAPHLGLSFVAGAEGLGRRVSWTHVSDLEDPAAWLDGGELLITNGLSLPASAAGQVHYLSRLAEARAAGLAIGVRNPPLTPELQRRADELAFPLLRVARETPFLAVSRFVAAANQDAAHRRLLTHVRIFDGLRPRAAEEFTALELFRYLEGLTGYSLFVVTATGRPLPAGMPELPGHLVEHLLGVADRTPSIPGGYAVQIPVRSTTPAFLVALERRDEPTAGLGAVRHVATIAALELANLMRDRETDRRRGAETLSELLAGRLESADAERRMGELGFSSQTPIVVAAIRAHEPGLDDALHHRLCDLGAPHLLLAQDDLLLVVPAEPDDLSPAVHDLAAHVGISQPRAGLAEWATARKEASWALQRAIGGPTGRIVRFAEGDSATQWMPSDINALRELAHRTLGPLLDYDVQHASTMVQSLRVFFAHERRLAPAAEALFVHKHTLSYRLRRIEEISGRSLNRMQDLTELWMALKALEVLGEAPLEGPGADGDGA